MHRARDQQEFLVVPLQLLKRVLAEIRRVRRVAVNHEDGIANLSAVLENRHVHKGECRRQIPSVRGVDGTRMVAARGLVVRMIVLDELWRICR